MMITHRSTKQISSEERTIWLANGKSVDAVVKRVAFDGIEVSITNVSGFIKATELCTADRVHYGFATRKEREWLARMNTNAAKQVVLESKLREPNE